MATTSTLEMALLGLLRGKPQSGYDLRKTFTMTAMSHYSDSPGSIYPALRRLESRGWILGLDPSGSSQEGGRRRQVFALTEAGKGALTAWLEQEVTAQDVRERSAELLLRFAFMDGSVPRSRVILFLDQLIAGLASQLDAMHAQFRDMSSRVPHLHTGLLAFEAGIRGLEAQLAWAQGARARLNDRE
ncbi:PadR family transcriptional regulator [Acidobacteria bacterium AB60]|nr:PadR family transcriptional regulator [Acidobacteria bacterium AB60]